MASRVCWQCSTAAHQTPVSTPYYSAQAGSVFAAYRCDECGVLSVAHGAFGNGVTGQTKDLMERAGALLTWLPEKYSGHTYADVPDHIASAANEAHLCFSAQAFRGAIVMARAVVEATAKEVGVEGPNLASRIQGLLDAGHIRQIVKETADEIRFMGNDMAHGDFVAPVTSEAAEDVLAFMAEVLDEVFQAPARLRAHRDARLARRAETE